MELNASILRIRDAISPYTRFVRVEREKLDRAQTDLAATQARIAATRARVERIG
jgi:hypothetical protein